MIRVGFGIDVHKFVENRDLWIGGVKIPYEYGLAGHSDADVLIHAICDALLGAANLRDIGYQFPDNSDECLNIDSKITAVALVLVFVMITRTNRELLIIAIFDTNTAIYFPQLFNGTARRIGKRLEYAGNRRDVIITGSIEP